VDRRTRSPQRRLAGVVRGNPDDNAHSRRDGTAISAGSRIPQQCFADWIHGQMILRQSGPRTWCGQSVQLATASGRDQAVSPPPVRAFDEIASQVCPRRRFRDALTATAGLRAAAEQDGVSCDPRRAARGRPRRLRGRRSSLGGPLPELGEDLPRCSKRALAAMRLTVPSVSYCSPPPLRLRHRGRCPPHSPPTGWCRRGTKNEPPSLPLTRLGRHRDITSLDARVARIA